MKGCVHYLQPAMIPGHIVECEVIPSCEQVLCTSPTDHVCTLCQSNNGPMLGQSAYTNTGTECEGKIYQTMLVMICTHLSFPLHPPPSLYTLPPPYVPSLLPTLPLFPPSSLHSLPLPMLARCSWLGEFCYPGVCPSTPESCNCTDGFTGQSCLQGMHCQLVT